MIITSKFNSTCKVCGGTIGIGEQINWDQRIKGVSHVDTVKCNGLKLRNMMVDNPAVPKPLNVKMLPLAELMKGIDLKRPTLRLKFEDKTVTLSLTRAGIAPGSIAIKIEDVFIGCVRPTGEMSGRLPSYTELQDYLLSVSVSKEELVKQAVIYGKFTNSCSFCGLELTHDYSVMVGYGPICADKWGLPHAYNGTADNVPNLPANMKEKFMKLMMEEE